VISYCSYVYIFASVYNMQNIAYYQISAFNYVCKKEISEIIYSHLYNIIFVLVYVYTAVTICFTQTSFWIICTHEVFG